MTHDYTYDYGPDHEHVDNDISFGARIRILAQVFDRGEELQARSDAWAEFWNWAVYSLSLSADLENGVDRDLSEDDYEMVLEAWIDFTHLLDIDHHQPFESLDDCLAAAAL